MSRLHQVVSCDRDGQATVVDASGRPGVVSLLALDGPAPRPGEWLLVHSGYAIERLGEDEALRTLAELGSPDEGGSQ